MRQRHILRAIFTCQAVILLCVVNISADDSASLVCQRDGKPQACNGISVGEPKVFDNRSLQLMLEELSKTLAAQQQSYLDQKSVLAALSNLQGYTLTDVSRALNIAGSTTPATSAKGTPTTGSADTSGKTSSDASTSKGTATTQAAASESLSFPTIPGFNPTYGLNASDLLNDQVNLTYQIMNLRMLLERSLSDRLLSVSQTGTDNYTRLQTVLGFNVTLDPPRTANDAVAVVEITVTRSQTGNPDSRRDLSLVGLMPQEKTYNAATFSNKSNAFGGSAVVNAFQVGYSQRKREQIFYLYRDNDTLSYERMTGDPNKIVFGWMFRPVLGRHSVSPGLRQMFAILALPSVDCDDQGPEDKKKLEDGKKLENEKKQCLVKLNTDVRTYWKKYDRGTLSSYEHHDTNRAKAFWFKLSASLSTPQIFSDRRYENDASYSGPEVSSTVDYQKNLKPRLASIEWRPTGAKNIVISATGRNFFTGTKVAMGDKIYATESDGLVLKSNQAFDLTTTMDALVNGSGIILGRYGTGVPFEIEPKNVTTKGIEIWATYIGPSLGGIRKIEIILVKKGQQQASVKEQEATTKDSRETAHNERMNTQLKLENLPPETPVVSINGVALDLPYHMEDTTGGGAFNSVSIEASAKDSVVSQNAGGIVKVLWPFYPQENWRAAARFSDPDSAFPVTRVSQKTILISRVDGLDFAKGPEITEDNACWHLIAGGMVQTLKTSRCTRVDAECSEEASGADKNNGSNKNKNANSTCRALTSLPPPSDYVVAATIEKPPERVMLVAPNGATYMLAVPELKAKETKTQALEIKQYDSLWIEVKAQDLKTGGEAKEQTEASNLLSKVTRVEANGKTLQMIPQKGTTESTETKKISGIKSIKVEITRDLTEKPGTVDIAFLAADGTLVGTKPLQITRTEWSGKGDK